MGIIYKGLRVGKNGKLFYIYKIRTMVEGADKISKFEKDGLVTPIGRFLRRYKIDELPQFWNIIKGDMAIVGPRPEEKEFIDLIPEKDKNTILSVKPGLTDISTIKSFGGWGKISENQYENYIKNTFPQKIALQVFYVKNKSLLLDIKIVLWTLWNCVKRLGGIF